MLKMAKLIMISFQIIILLTVFVCCKAEDPTDPPQAHPGGHGPRPQTSDRRKVMCLDQLSMSVVNSRLSCMNRPGRVIYVEKAVYGYNTAPGCNHEKQSGRCEEDATVSVSKCNMREDCNLAVTPRRLNHCDKTSNYLLIEYSCVRDSNHVHDICHTPEDQSSKGHIVSSSYPTEGTHLPQEASCYCELDVEPGAWIDMEILDFDLSPNNNGECKGNDVILESLDEQDGVVADEFLCGSSGRGRRIRSETNRANVILTTGANTNVHGFWFKYEGRRPNGQEAQVKIQCYEDLDISNLVTSTLTPDEGFTDDSHTTESPQTIGENIVSFVEKNWILVSAIAGAGFLLLLAAIVGIVCCCRCHKKPSQPVNNNKSDVQPAKSSDHRSASRPTPPLLNQGKTTEAPAAISNPSYSQIPGENSYEALTMPSDPPPAYQPMPPQSSKIPKNAVPILPPLDPSAPYDYVAMDGPRRYEALSPNQGKGPSQYSALEASDQPPVYDNVYVDLIDDPVSRQIPYDNYLNPVN